VLGNYIILFIQQIAFVTFVAPLATDAGMQGDNPETPGIERRQGVGVYKNVAVK
jgi:hypothetical protein